MAIQIRFSPEPLSKVSLQSRQQDDLHFARCQAYDVLRHQIWRYVNDELRGNSILISGHRGMGKTAQIAFAVVDVQHAVDIRDSHKRLLLVELHGPALIRGGDEPPRKAKPAPAREPPLVPTAPASPLPQIDESSNEERLLIQIVVALHLTLIGEIADRYWSAVHRGEKRTAVATELAAEFSRELDDFPTPARLRDYWKRAGSLETGLLFDADRRPASAPSDPGEPQAASQSVIRQSGPDQGFRELLLLASSVEIYRRVSGTFTHHEKDEQGEGEQRESGVSSVADLKNLALPAVGVLTGGLVGGGAIASNMNGLLAGVIGVVSGLVATIGLRFVSRKTYDHTLTRSSRWERDLTVKSLRRELPRLVQRMTEAGIYPIFLVDELDKVSRPRAFDELVAQLKVVFAERAFFCFAADRDYYDKLLNWTRPGQYPKAATIYRHRLFVVYLPEDLFDYLDTVLQYD